jgi:hypothetical protein
MGYAAVLDHMVKQYLSVAHLPSAGSDLDHMAEASHASGKPVEAVACSVEGMAAFQSR